MRTSRIDWWNGWRRSFYSAPIASSSIPTHFIPPSPPSCDTTKHAASSNTSPSLYPDALPKHRYPAVATFGAIDSRSGATKSFPTMTVSTDTFPHIATSS